MLNARTGALIKALSTTAGSASVPSGLAHISAYSENADLDRTIDYVYGGDLQGNVWRFDLSGNNSSQWDVVRLATLKTADGSGGTAQPITSAPELGKVAGKRLVLVGTGRYFSLNDVAGTATPNAGATQQQSFYALVDDRNANPVISPLRSNLQQQTLSLVSGAQMVTASSNAVDLATKKGWYVDFPQTGERSITDPVLVNGSIIFVTNIPNYQPCEFGGTSWLYALNVRDGRAVNTWAGQFMSRSMASGIMPARTAGQSPVAGYHPRVDGNGAEKKEVLPGASAAPVQRKLWREILTR